MSEFDVTVNHGKEPFLTFSAAEVGGAQQWHLFWTTTPAELRRLADELEVALDKAKDKRPLTDLLARKTIRIGGNWREGGLEREFAGLGTVDENGLIECSAELDGNAYELIEEQIAAGDHDGKVQVVAEDGRKVTYYWSLGGES